jgi:hypothetical protein
LFVVAWSRANRKLTRRLSWYLLFPFTLINLAGQMAPPGRGFERIVRLGVGITSVLLTASVAAWITVIVETIWRAVTDAPDNALTRMVLCASGPAAIIAVVFVRMSRGRAGVATGPRCSSCHVVALLGLMVISYFGPAGRHYPPNTDSSWWKSLQDNTVDPMTYLLVASIATVMIVALVLSTIAVVTRLRPRACSAANAGSSLAAAAFLMLAATAVLHTAGSLPRLVAAYVMGLVQTIGHVVTDAVQTPHYMQLPQPADLTEALRMDLMPAFFGVFVLIFAGRCR